MTYKKCYKLSNFLRVLIYKPVHLLNLEQEKAKKHVLKLGIFFNLKIFIIEPNFFRIGISLSF